MFAVDRCIVMLLVVQQRVSFRALALKGYKPPGCAPCRPCCGCLCSVVIDAAFPVIEFNVFAAAAQCWCRFREASLTKQGNALGFDGRSKDAFRASGWLVEAC